MEMIMKEQRTLGKKQLKELEKEAMTFNLNINRWLTPDVYKWREKKERIADGINRTKQIVFRMGEGSACQYVSGK